MTKVLHIIQRLSRGGAARALIATAKHSAKLDTFQHSILSLLPITEQYMVELAEEAGIAVRSAQDRAAIIKEMEEADIVHVHFWNNPKVYELLRSELPPIRMLIWFHIAGETSPQIIPPKLVDCADFALATSPRTMEIPAFQNLPSEVKKQKTGVVYGSCDFDRLANLQKHQHSTFNVGYIGTVDFVKMHPNYVKMSSQIDVPNVKFIVCGDGSSRKILHQEAQALGVADKFDFRGYVEDIKPVIETLDVFGYPLCEDNYSTAELVLHEVMYAEIPPVIFPYGGAQNTVIHNQTGLIVQNELEYKQAMEYLYHHPEEKLRLGRNAREYAQQFFGAENAAKQINPIYNKLMALPKRRRSWGIPVGTSLINQPVLLEDLIANYTEASGAELFRETLGDAAPQFEISMSSHNPAELFEADRKIACSSPVLYSKGGGGIFHYRNDYFQDGYLRLWSGLVLQEQGNLSEAIAEFTEAIKLGCDHWRVSWYLAQAQAQLAEKSVREVTESVPGFAEAQGMLSRLSNQLPTVPQQTSVQQAIAKSRTENITIFAIPKAFKGHIGIIQRNAITSWTKLQPRPEIILFGEDEGTAEIAQELNVRYVPKIKCNEYGTPLLSDIFCQAQKLAVNEIVVYANSDMILLQDLLAAVQQISQVQDEFVMIGRRWNMDITTPLNFADSNWSDALRQLTLKTGTLHSVHGKDYFVFPKHLYPKIPEFAVGRAAWDNWMVQEALNRKYSLIDATQGVMAIHQNHDYAHLKGGKLESSRGKEAEQNKVAGGYAFSGTIADATQQFIPRRPPKFSRVSIIITAHNQAATLGKAIESVLGQTYKDYEIIVVDDGSEDDTRHILEPYYDRIRYIYQNPQGKLVARNRGIQAATGEFVGFLEADCWFLPDKLEEQVACFDRRGCLEMTHSGWQIENSRDGIVNTVEPWRSLPNLDPDELHIWKLYKLWQRFPMSAMMFRRTWLDLMGGFDTLLQPDVAEIDLIVRSALKGCLGAWLRQPTYCCQQREIDKVETPDRVAESCERLLDGFFQRPEIPDWMHLLQPQAQYNTLVFLAWFMYRTGDSDRTTKYLNKSLKHTPYLTQETALDWVDNFTRFARDSGCEFNPQSLQALVTAKL